MKQQKPGSQKPADPQAESFDPQPLLDLIAAEMRVAMTLTGATSIAQISRDMLAA